MEMFLSMSGLIGAACCVGMYAAVSLGRLSAERPVFFAVNGVGSVLILLGAAHQFDLGDMGTVGQELIWAAVSMVGAGRAWWRSGGDRRVAEFRRAVSPDSVAFLGAMA